LFTAIGAYLMIHYLLHYQRNIVPALLCMIIYLVMIMSACTKSHQYFEALSDETLSLINTPLNTLQEVARAQKVIRKRLWKDIKRSEVQSKLRGFACLLFAQTLDPSTARGERASKDYLCKRSRLPADKNLPKLYYKVAQRYDKLLWKDLQASQSWSQYAQKCLNCEQASEAKILTCLHQVASIDLLQNQEEAPFKDWWLRCQSEKNKKIQALLKYRKWILNPVENLPFPLLIDHLPKSYQDKLTQRSILGEAKRLEIAILDGEKTQVFLTQYPNPPNDDPKWTHVWSILQNRIDTQLIPCLEWGIDACTHVAQREQSRLRAIRYVEVCQRCKYQDQMKAWLSHLPIQFIPRWHLQGAQAITSILANDLIVYAGTRLTRFNLAQAQAMFTANIQIQKKSQPIDTWSYFSQEKSDWFTGTPQGSPYSLLGSRHMSRTHISPSIKPEKVLPYLWLHSEYQLTAIDQKEGQVKWIFNYPIQNDKVIQQCEQVVQISGSLLACIGSQSLYFLNRAGLIVARMSCPLNQCGKAHPVDKPYLALLNKQAPDRLHILDLSELYQQHQITQQASDEVITLSPVISTVQLAGEIRSVHAKQGSILLSSARHVLLYNLNQRHQKPIQWQIKMKMPLEADPLLDQSTQSFFLLSAQGFQKYNLDRGVLLWQKNINKGHARSRRVSAQLKKQKYVFRHSQIMIQEHALLVADSYSQKIVSYNRFSGELLWKAKVPQKIGQVLSLQEFTQQVILLLPKKGEILAYQLGEGKLQWQWQGKAFTSAQFSHEWAVIQNVNEIGLYSLKAEASPVIKSAKKQKSEWEMLQREAQKKAENRKRFTRKKSQRLRDLSPKFYIPNFSLVTQIDMHKLTNHSEMQATQACQLGDYTQCVNWAEQQVKQNLTHEYSILKDSMQKDSTQKDSTASTLLPDLLSSNLESSLANACDWGEGKACLMLGDEVLREQLSEALREQLSEALRKHSFKDHKQDQLKPISHTRIALKLYEKAKDLQQVNALVRLGDLYQKSGDIKINHQKARSYFQQACDSKIMQGCSRLAWLYELGLGAYPKPVAALKLYQMACVSGDDWACKQKSRLQKQKK
jgi:TPR repeat protein